MSSPSFVHSKASRLTNFQCLKLFNKLNKQFYSLVTILTMLKLNAFLNINSDLNMHSIGMYISYTTEGTVVFSNHPNASLQVSVHGKMLTLYISHFCVCILITMQCRRMLLKMLSENCYRFRTRAENIQGMFRNMWINGVQKGFPL